MPSRTSLSTEATITISEPGIGRVPRSEQYSVLRSESLHSASTSAPNDFRFPLSIPSKKESSPFLKTRETAM